MTSRGRFADVVIRSEAPIPELEPATKRQDGFEELVVTRGEAEGPITWFHHWVVPDGTVWADFGETADSYRVRFPDLAEFSVARDGRRVQVSASPSVPEHTQRHLLLNQVLPLALSLTGRTVLHAGAVEWNGRGVVILGPSGSGKSTLVAACARAGAGVMADDSVVLRHDAAGWSAVPSYPAIRLWPSALQLLGLHDDGAAPRHAALAHYFDKRRVRPDSEGWRFHAEPVPVSLVVVLSSSASSARPVAVDALSQVFRMDLRDPGQSRQVFERITQLLLDVPVLRVGQQPDERQADELAARVRDMA